jgi:hypothetical protein
VKTLARIGIGFVFWVLVIVVTVLLGKTVSDLGILAIALMVFAFWFFPSMIFKLFGWFQDPEESEESKKRSRGAW